MEPEKKSNGALVGLVVIIIILIIGGIYIWQSNKNDKEKMEETPIQSEAVTDSIKLNTLEQDLKTTDIDVGANAIDSVN